MKWGVLQYCVIRPTYIPYISPDQRDIDALHVQNYINCCDFELFWFVLQRLT